ncbi:MAG: hypothetical protein E6R07_00820 [Nevskiaceae bacterium]|nr:MAG: hypothetical protein E6R07_00820 [Nevskiaceae bacterium]
MISTYDPWLVALSCGVAAFASFVGLSLSTHIRRPDNAHLSLAWLLAGGSVMGIGIWGMHFIGMLALKLPFTVTYSLPATLASLGIAVVIACFALYTCNLATLGEGRLLVASLLMGLGIVSMHHSGMAAMQLSPGPYYHPGMLLLSAIFAVAASQLALRMVYRRRSESLLEAPWSKAGAALVMGMGIAGMHYIGMAATEFAPQTVTPGNPQTLGREALALVIGAGAALLILITLGAAVIETRLGQIRGDNEKLEARVRERTASLTAANETLQREIGDRRLVEEKLARSMESLQLINRELEQFAYIASHDLQAPLRTISGFCQLLQRRYRESLDAQANDYIQHIVQSAAHMQRLISGLLEFSRVGGQMRIETVDLEMLLQQAQKNLHAVITARGAEITHGPLPKVIGSALELTQLLQNLIGNGIKFQPGAHPRVHLSAVRDGKFWRVSVADQGIGIAEDDQRDIFLIFRRLHGESEYEGTGIGLSICQKIVKQHGGDIWVDSRPGEGATFHFTLKAIDTPATAAPERMPAVSTSP